jgi:hypothetical protein
MPAFVGEAVCGLRAGHIAPLVEQQPQIERAGGIAAVGGPAIGRFRASRVAPLFEQHPEIGRGRRVSAAICPRVGILRRCEVTLPSQLRAQREGRPGVLAVGRRAAGARRDGGLWLLGTWLRPPPVSPARQPAGSASSPPVGPPASHRSNG